MSVERWKEQRGREEGRKGGREREREREREEREHDIYVYIVHQLYKITHLRMTDDVIVLKRLEKMLTPNTAHFYIPTSLPSHQCTKRCKDVGSAYIITIY